MLIENGKSNLIFHHYGLAVKHFTKATIFYQQLGYDCSEPVIDLLQNVELVLCTSPNYPTVELVKPINEKSPIINYLKNCNEMIYHICYEIDNIANVKKLFPNNRVICTSKPKPAILFDNRLVSFYYINDVGLVELLQK